MADAQQQEPLTSSNLLTIFDAVHGRIDISDPETGPTGNHTIAGLLVSRPLQRLQHLKQIDFAYHSYPAGDHSRYAHALGTMQMMRRLMAQCGASPSFRQSVLGDLLTAYPDIGTGSDEEDYSVLTRHMLVAALLQDLGELPCGQTTKHIFRPNEDTRKFVEEDTGLNTAIWSTKAVFTVACILRLASLGLLDGYHVDLLAFLVTGQSPLPLETSSKLKPLLLMLDGAIDADRLDYVFRDAYHTIGGSGSPLSVINTLIEYDEFGPIVSDPVPASTFFATRAFLYTSVYHSPANRFRVHLLLEVLHDSLRNSAKRAAQALFGKEAVLGPTGVDLSLDDFLDLDDVKLTAGIDRLDKTKTARAKLSVRARGALDLLVNTYKEYDYFWLPSSEPSGTRPKAFSPPRELFFDTFLDQRDRSLYQPRSVRVKSDNLRCFEQPLPLESCGDLYNGLLSGGGSMLPMQENILLFVPHEIPTSAGWNNFRASLKSGWLYSELIERDPLGPFDVPSDTRSEPGFEGPHVFISFAQQDIAVVKAIADELLRRRRHYYLYLPGYRGLGGTPAYNSIQAVKDAAAVLVVASVQYAARYRDAPSGNIAQEIMTIHERHVESKNTIPPVAVVSADDSREIEERLPWRMLGFDGCPYVGAPISAMNPSGISDALTEALNTIDEALDKH
jgi:HD superfamily phosphohydrolase